MPPTDHNGVRDLIIAARRQGHSEAFGVLFNCFTDDLARRFERRLARFPALRKKHAVEDMVQETAMSALRGFRTYQGEDPELFHRWLTRIARTVFADAVRHSRKKKRDMALEHSRLLSPLLADGESPTVSLNLEDTGNPLGDRREQAPSSKAAIHERREILLEVMEELSPHYRQVISLRCIQGLSVADTAGIMKIDRRYVEVMRLRAMKKLGERLLARGYNTASF